MNVAITRAKELLVVIGNGALLQRDPYWKAFLAFTIRNKLWVGVIHIFISSLIKLVCVLRYQGPVLDLEMDGNYISRLELVAVFFFLCSIVHTDILIFYNNADHIW